MIADAVSTSVGPDGDRNGSGYPNAGHKNSVRGDQADAVAARTDTDATADVHELAAPVSPADDAVDGREPMQVCWDTVVTRESRARKVPNLPPFELGVFRQLT
jgi:hypothetical protein